MSQPRNPYESQKATSANTGEDKNVSMQDSPSSKRSSEEEQANDAGMEDEE